jgi:hypothetical protein
MEQALLILGGVVFSVAFIAVVRALAPQHEVIVYGVSRRGCGKADRAPGAAAAARARQIRAAAMEA